MVFKTLFLIFQFIFFQTTERNQHTKKRTKIWILDLLFSLEKKINSRSDIEKELKDTIPLGKGRIDTYFRYILGSIFIIQTSKISRDEQKT